MKNHNFKTAEEWMEAIRKNECTLEDVPKKDTILFKEVAKLFNEEIRSAFNDCFNQVKMMKKKIQQGE